MLFGQTTPVNSGTEISSGLLGGYFIFALVLTVFLIVAYWKIFEKAGEKGWKSIIPLYNNYTLFRIAGRNGWWFIALFIPFISIVVLIILSIDLAKHFGKSTVFGVFGLFFFNIIGYLILGFGDAKYVGTKHE